MQSSLTPQRHTTSFSGSQYLLPSDEVEKARLQTQHDVITRVLGNRLTLSPVELQPGDKVLDSGSGACSWVLDLASQVPKSVQIFGIDIETRLFPATLPENVTTKITSILNLPEEWTNEFQLVHQRLLIAALLKDQWPTAIRELFRVTKPNGWVELCEGGTSLTSQEPRLQSHKGTQIFVPLFDGTNHEPNIARFLPQLLRDAGFTDVQTVEAAVPIGKWAGRDGVDGRDVTIGSLRTLKALVLKMGIAKTENEYDEIMDDLERICDETPGTVFKYYTVYGRKPS